MRIQFHLTNQCNLRCRHCYQDNYENNTISLENFKIIIDKIKDYFDPVIYDELRISLTGGEPLLIPNFTDYLQYINDKVTNCMILTNGLLLTNELCEFLFNMDPKMSVQMSLEGPKEINDSIRGTGVYDKVLESIGLLNDHMIYSVISCTIAQYNYNKIKELYYDLNTKTKLNTLWFDRCIPFKDVEGVTTEQFRSFINDLKDLRTEYKNGDTSVIPAYNRALQFFARDNIMNCYQCTAGTFGFTIMPNGDVMPCRRLDMVIGNALYEKWENILEENKQLLDTIDSVPEECQSCEYGNDCRGGLKCLTYHTYHDFNHKDVNCLC